MGILNGRTNLVVTSRLIKWMNEKLTFRLRQQWWGCALDSNNNDNFMYYLSSSTRYIVADYKPQKVASTFITTAHPLKEFSFYYRTIVSTLIHFHYFIFSYFHPVGKWKMIMFCFFWYLLLFDKLWSFRYIFLNIRMPTAGSKRYKDESGKIWFGKVY